jgi:hypothetical protein
MGIEEKPKFVGGWWRRAVRLRGGELVLKEGRSEYEVRPPLRLGPRMNWLPIWGTWFSGRLYLTDKRLIWCPSIIQFWVRPVCIPLEDITEVRRVSQARVAASDDWFVRTGARTYRFDPGLDFLHGPDADDWLTSLKLLLGRGVSVNGRP